MLRNSIKQLRMSGGVRLGGCPFKRICQGPNKGNLEALANLQGCEPVLLALSPRLAAERLT